MTNVFRAEETKPSAQVVELARFGGISPDRFVEGNRNRIAIKDKLAREADVLANRARQDRINQMRLSTEESTSIIAAAREEANGIIEKAISEKDRITAEAKAAGMEQAREEARAESLLAVDDGLSKLEEVIESLKTTKERFLRAGAETMVDIATATLEKILHGKVHASPVLILKTIDAAITSVSAGDEVMIRVHPDDLGTAEDYRREIISRVEGLTSVSFRADPGITRGGVLIETEFGRVDGRLESQMTEILREIEITVRSTPVATLAEFVDDKESIAAEKEPGERPSGPLERISTDEDPEGPL